MADGNPRAGSQAERPVARRAASRPRLSAQQRLFVHEYLLDRNATQAAIRAGYSQKSAASQASDLLKNPKIQGLIEQRLERLTEKTELKLERVVLELHRILLADPSEALNENGGVLPLRDWPVNLRRAMSGLDVEELWEGRGPDRAQTGEVKKIRFWSKTEASQQLLRVLGAFKDKLEVEHTVTYSDLVVEAARRRAARQGEPPPPPAPRAQA